MIAVVKIGGHQAIVKVGDTLEVDKLSVEVGKKIKFDTLLVSEEDGKNFKIGAPILDGIQVEAKIIEHGRGDKIRVFKMKPRKRYHRLQGHRQDYTVIEITTIGAAAKPTAEKKAVAKPTVKKETPVVPSKPKAKMPAKKKPVAAKTPATKKKVAKSAAKK